MSGCVGNVVISKSRWKFLRDFEKVRVLKTSFSQLIPSIVHRTIDGVSYEHEEIRQIDLPQNPCPGPVFEKVRFFEMSRFANSRINTIGILKK